MARSGAPRSAYIRATPYPTVPSDNTALMFVRAKAAESAAQLMRIATTASWNAIGVERLGAGRIRPVASAVPTNVTVVTTTTRRYERNEALWRAGETHRLSESRPESAPA